MSRNWWVKRLFGSRPSPIRTHRPTAKPTLTFLEDRSVPATLTDGGTSTLTIDLDGTTEQLSISTDGTNYLFSVNGANAFADGGVADPTNDFDAFGAGTLTLQATGVARYTSVLITDSTAGDSVAFLDSTTKDYASNFTTVLDSGSAGVTFAGASSFATNSLNAILDRSIAVNAGATVTATTGNLSFTANSGGATTGNFVGVDVQGNVTTTGSGSITIAGTGGDQATGSQFGVRVQATVSTGGLGNLTITGTGGASTGDNNSGVIVSGAAGIVSGKNGITSVSGFGGGSGALSDNNFGAFVTNDALITSTGTGVVNVSGTGGAGIGTANDGIRLSVATPTITSGGSQVSIQGTVGAGTIGVGVRLLNNATILSAGTSDLSITTNSLAIAATATVQAGTAGTNVLTIIPQTAGTLIDLGSVVDTTANTLEISSAELNRLFADAVIIGDGASGNIAITKALAPTNIATTLNLTSGGTITDTATGNVTIPNLGLTGTTVTLDSAANSVNFVSGSSSTGAFTFTNNTDLTINAPGVTGATDVTIALASAKVLTISNPIAATTGAVTLLADDVDITSTVTASNATNGLVRIAPVTAATNIDLGTDTGLGLTQADLNQIAAGVALQIGDTTNTGTITQSLSLAAPAGFTRLDLQSTGAITESAGTTLAVGSISFVSGGAVSYDKAGNQIGTVAASLSVGNKAFAFQSDSGLIVGTVGAIVGISTKSTIAVTTTDAATAGQDITISSPVLSTNGNITFNAGDTMAINSTITTNKAAGTITLNVDFSGVDPDVGVGATVTIAGSQFTAAGGLFVNGGSDNDTFNATASTTTAITINGNLPSAPALPGDTLIVDAQTNGISQGAGSVTVTGKAVINYSEIETFSVINAGGSTIPGTNGNDTIVIQRNGAVTQFNLNSAGFQTIFGNSLTFNGGNGDDTMIVNITVDGSPALTGGIFYNGGTAGQVNGDLLRVNGFKNGSGVAVTTGTSNPGAPTAGGNTGTVTVAGQLITYTELQPIDVVDMASFSLVLPAGKDVVALTSSKLFSDITLDALRATGTSGGLAFEDHAFRNVSNLTIDTTAVNDDVTAGQGDAITVNAFNATQQVWGLNIVTTAAPFVAGGLDTVTLNGPITIARDPVALTDGALNIATNTVIDNGGTVTTDGAQTYNAATTTLAAASAFTSTNVQAVKNIAFTGNLTGAFDAAINTGGVTSIAGNVDVNSLATDFAGFAGESTTFGAGTTTKTATTQAYFDDVIVTGDRTFQSTLAGGKTISFNRGLTGAFNVVATTLGDTNFNGVVSVNSLTTNGGGNTNVNGGLVQTASFQNFQDAVVTGGANSTFASTGGGKIQFASTLTGTNDVAVNTSGQTEFDAAVSVGTLVTDAVGSTAIAFSGTVQTVGLQQYKDPVAIPGFGPVTFASTAGDVRFEQTLSGTDITVNATGLTVFNGNVNGGTLTVNGPGTTNIGAAIIGTGGNQNFNENVVLTANVLFSSSSGITFGGSLTGNFAAETSAFLPATFNGPVSVGSLTTSGLGGGGSAVFNTGSVTASTFLKFDVAVTANVDVAFTASTGNANFNGTLTATNKAVTVNSPGATTFAAAVNVGSLTTDAPGTTTIGGGSVTSSSFQKYNDAVTLTQGTLFTSTGSGNVDFAQSLDGNQPVTVRTGGATVFSGPVVLSSLETDAPGTTVINSAAVTATQFITFRDVVTLNAATTFTSGGQISFLQAVNGGGSAAINGAAITLFQGPVNIGGSLSTDAAGNTVVSGGSVTTGGTQTYSDGVTASSATTFAGIAGVTFNSVLTSNFAVAVNSSNATRFGGDVTVAVLTTDAGGTTTIATASVATSGDMTFGDPVLLATNTRVSSANGSIDFKTATGESSGSTASLTANAGNGNITFGDTVLLASSSTLTIDAVQNFTLVNGLTAGRLVENVGNQTATLNGPITVTGIGGNAVAVTSRQVSIGGRIDAGSDVVLAATAGGVTQLAGSSIAAPTLGLFGTGTFTLDQPGNDIRNSLRSNTSGGPVRIADANDLTVDSAGIVTNDQNVTLRIGTDFTAVDPREFGKDRYSTPIINLGSGIFIAEAGLAGPAKYRFDVEIKAARAILGSQAGDNRFVDGFVVRPSQTTPITSFGSAPFVAPGDTYTPIFDGTPVLQFVYNGKDGFYQFSGRAKIDFFSIESLNQLSITGFVVQTGEQSDAQNNVQVQYEIRVLRSQAGQFLPGGLNGSAIRDNTFVVAPKAANAAAPTPAPRIAFGDVNGDGTPDLIVANGPGTSPLITVINGNRLNPDDQGNLQLTLDQAILEATTNPALAAQNPAILAQFYAYEPTFLGGVNLAVGDLDGDGRADIITGADIGGGARVRRFVVGAADPTNPAASRYPLNFVSTDDFFAYEESYRGGVRVAVGDINHDGVPDLVLGAGNDGGPRVRVLSGKAHNAAGLWGNNGNNWSILADFFAYDSNFRGGIFVGAGDYDGDGYDDIVTGPGVSSSHIRVFSGRFLTSPRTGDQLTLANFFALETGNADDSLFPVAGPIQLVSGVAFGAPDPSTGFRTVLVSSGRGNRVRVEEYAGNKESIALVTKAARPDGNLIKDASITKISVDADKISYGATVAGFTQLLG